MQVEFSKIAKQTLRDNIEFLEKNMVYPGSRKPFNRCKKSN